MVSFVIVDWGGVVGIVGFGCIGGVCFVDFGVGIGVDVYEYVGVDCFVGGESCLFCCVKFGEVFVDFDYVGVEGVFCVVIGCCVDVYELLGYYFEFVV